MILNNLLEWQLWMHPYPTMIKQRGRYRTRPGLFKVKKVFQSDTGPLSLEDIFEARKTTGPQLKRCVRAVATKELKGVDGAGKAETRAALSKGFAVCTAQLQKGGYLKKGTQAPTKVGKSAGKSKAAQQGHTGKVMDYEGLLSMARR